MTKSEQLPEREEILQELRSHAPRAMHVGELCGRMGLSRRLKDDVVRSLLLLAEDGLVREMPGLRFRALKPSEVIERRSETKTQSRQRRATKTQRAQPVIAPPVEVGLLTMTRQGYGFVNLFDGRPDVFIPPDAVGPALHGDRVQVRAHPSPKGREGRIVGIVARRPSRVTGLLKPRGRAMVFEPDDDRLRSPMRVVDERPPSADRNKVLLAEIVGFPQRTEDRAEVRIVEALGAEGLARIEVEKIKVREGVVEEFPEDVQRAAAALPSRVDKRNIQGREDLRELDLVTIDPETARDHDDAIWVERHQGGYRLVVAIADVSFYVPEGSALDREALYRSTSIYLPDRAIPMLPPELSTHLASLVPQRDRLCMAVEMIFDDKAHLSSHRIVEGVMRSRAKLTYEGVARALSLSDEGPRQPAADKRVDSLRVLLELSRKLRARRTQRGSLDFDLPEAKIVLDPKTGEPTSIVQSRKDPGIRKAYQIVEDMMLITNEVVAMHLKRHAIPGIFRIHGNPDPERVEIFCEVAKTFGHELDPESADSPKQFAKFFRKIEGTPEASLLRYLLLRAMQQAMYDTDPSVGHFALATKDYLHFTSPIRRYPDLVVHRILREVVRGEPIDAAFLRPKFQRIAAQASERERRALTVERDVMDVYRSIYMQDYIGETYEGRISGLAPFGIFVQIDDPFVSVLLPFEQLDDVYEQDKLGIRLIGQRTAQVFTMNDRVTVRIEEANVGNRQVIGSLIGHEATTRPERSRKKPPKQREQPQRRRSRKASRKRKR